MSAAAPKKIVKKIKKSISKAVKKQANRSANAMFRNIKPPYTAAQDRAYNKVRARLLRGRGGYFQDAINFGENTGDPNKQRGLVNRGVRHVASSVANAIIPGSGTIAGNVASWFSNLVGFGAYSIKKNSLVQHANGPTGAYMGSGFPSNAPPMFASMGVGSDIVISGREYIQDISSSNVGSVLSFMLNPGNPTVFPWLSQLAALYEEYEFLGLVFEFRSTSATVAISTSTMAMGSVVMATDYDCEDATFTSKRNMEAAEFSTQSVPYACQYHPIECDPRRNVISRGYVVPGATSVSSVPGDPRLSILGVTSIGVFNTPTTGDSIGELWVTHHTKLSRPVLEQLNNFSNWTTHISFILNTSGAISGTGGQGLVTVSAGIKPQIAIAGTPASLTIAFNNQAFVGSSFIIVTTSTIASTITTYASEAVTFGPGGSGTSWVQPAIAYGSSLNRYSLQQNSSASGIVVGNSQNSNTACNIFTVLTTALVVTVAPSYNNTASSGHDIFILPFNTNLSGKPPTEYQQLKSITDSFKDETSLSTNQLRILEKYYEMQKRQMVVNPKMRPCDKAYIRQAEKIVQEALDDSPYDVDSGDNDTPSSSSSSSSSSSPSSVPPSSVHVSTYQDASAKGKRGFSSEESQSIISKWMQSTTK